jgi:hypothetical protein
MTGNSDGEKFGALAFMGATEGKKHTLGMIRKIDKNFLFCGGNIRKLTLCVKKKCIVTYSVSGLWDRG